MVISFALKNLRLVVAVGGRISNNCCFRGEIVTAIQSLRVQLFTKVLKQNILVPSSVHANFTGSSCTKLRWLLSNATGYTKVRFPGWTMRENAPLMPGRGNFVPRAFPCKLGGSGKDPGNGWSLATINNSEPTLRWEGGGGG